jgi:hypothetical protein
MGFNPRILIFYGGFAPVKYQNSGVFPSWLSSYQIRLLNQDSGLEDAIGEADISSLSQILLKLIHIA